jgi:RNA polymerase sigma factor for flagellar operon FliA
MNNHNSELLSPEYINKDAALQLIEEHSSLVKRVVSSFMKTHPNCADRIELINSATIGLIGAINRFNPDKGDNFESYARIRIRGALLDKLRQEDSLSRTRRSFMNSFNQAVDKLSSKFMRYPSYQEISTELNMSIEQLQSILAEVEEIELNLEEADHNVEANLLGGKVSEVLDFEDRDPLLRLLRVENNLIIEGALKNLTPKQRLCIRLSFYEDMPLTKIAALLEVSVSRVSQIRTEALGLIKMDLQKLQ